MRVIKVFAYMVFTMLLPLWLFWRADNDQGKFDKSLRGSAASAKQDSMCQFENTSLHVENEKLRIENEILRAKSDNLREEMDALTYTLVPGQRNVVRPKTEIRSMGYILFKLSESDTILFLPSDAELIFIQNDLKNGITLEFESLPNRKLESFAFTPVDPVQTTWIAGDSPGSIVLRPGDGQVILDKRSLQQLGYSVALRVTLNSNRVHEPTHLWLKMPAR